MHFGLYLKRHIAENIYAYFFVVIMLVVGISAGTIAEGMLSPAQVDEIKVYLGTFISQLETNQVEGGTLGQTIWGHVKLSVFFWLTGTFVVGVPLIVIGIFAKGFVLGFSMGFLLMKLGWHGIAFAIAALVPHNLIAIPAYVAMASLALTHGTSHLNFLRKGRFSRRRRTGRQPFIRYSLAMLALLAALGISSLVEVYITPLLMRVVISFM